MIKCQQYFGKKKQKKTFYDSVRLFQKYLNYNKIEIGFILYISCIRSKRNFVSVLDTNYKNELIYVFF